MPNIVILSVGYDPLLSNTRGRVLGTGGYTVVPVLSLKLAITEFLQKNFDLIVLCHSIPIGDRECLAYLFRERSPNIPIVFVSSGFGEQDPSADATIMNDPNLLLLGVNEVLKRNMKGFKIRASG